MDLSLYIKSYVIFTFFLFLDLYFLNFLDFFLSDSSSPSFLCDFIFITVYKTKNPAKKSEIFKQKYM